MIVATKRILIWPIRRMDDCGPTRGVWLCPLQAYDFSHTRCMSGHTHEAYDYGLAHVVCVHTLGVWIWQHSECCYGQTNEVRDWAYSRHMILASHWQYDCIQTGNMVAVKQGVWLWPNTMCLIMITLNRRARYVPHSASCRNSSHQLKGTVERNTVIAWLTSDPANEFFG